MRLRLCVCRGWQMISWPFGGKRIKSGLFHFWGSGPLEGKRVHLRVDSPEKGILIMDASRMLVLNGTGVHFAYHLLKGGTDEEVVKATLKRYKVKRAEVENDLKEFKGTMYSLLSTRDIITEMDEELGALYEGQMAPFRMDLALTYRCDNECSHCYNDKQRAKRELTTAEWKRVLTKLWTLGIPHIVFTGGEPTLREDLPELIAFAEGQGQITGLNTNGRRFKDKAYLDKLVSAGLDHVQITVESHVSLTHDAITGRNGSHSDTLKGLKNALDAGIYTVTNTTIMERNKKEVLGTIEFLRKLGVKHIAVNSLIRSGKGKDAKGIEIGELKEILAKGCNDGILDSYEFRWYSPTPYCVLNPMEMGLGMKQCTACRMNMAVEPDGTVIPCQSYYEGLGNILKDPWKKIWEHKVCKDIRDRDFAPDKCRGCSLLPQCGGACPISWKTGDYRLLDNLSS